MMRTFSPREWLDRFRGLCGEIDGGLHSDQFHHFAGFHIVVLGQPMFGNHKAREIEIEVVTRIFLPLICLIPPHRGS